MLCIVYSKNLHLWKNWASTIKLTELVFAKHKSEPQTFLMGLASFTDIYLVQSLVDLDQIVLEEI